MSLTSKDVDHVAKLARLEITAEERERYTQQLNAILDHAAGLSKADVKGVEPTAHILPLKNIWREDALKPSLPREQALANASDKAKGCFRVPKIIDNGEG
jgi:aspartyl-tRNA(Asn)/glutamyl-tRNA(Gln) amidotransferase subunit C